MLFLGDDWAEAHHDIELQGDQGRVLKTRRLPEGVSGLTQLHEVIADHLDDEDEPQSVLVGIETDRGGWVHSLVAAGYTVYAINPKQAARYRERHTTSGAKSDPGDAQVLAEIVRTDRAHHRVVAGDSEQAEVVKTVARTHQTMFWPRQRQANQLRSMLRDFYPAALEAFGEELAGRDALAVLAIAPTPATGKTPTRSRVVSALHKVGRQRNLQKRAEEFASVLHADHLELSDALAEAYGISVRSLVVVLTTMVAQAAALEGDVERCFGQLPDAEIITSQPGLGVDLNARVLAEFGDGKGRYDHAKARRNYAGTSPITKTSCTRRVVLARYARNKRLADALHQQAFAALTALPGSRVFYDHRRARGATHHQALRTLFNRLVESSTAAFAPEPSTTRPPLGHTGQTRLLDDLHPGISGATRFPEIWPRRSREALPRTPSVCHPVRRNLSPVSQAANEYRPQFRMEVMSSIEEANKKIVTEFMSVFSTGDVDGILSYLSESATWWVAGSIPGISGVKDKAAFGDILSGTADSTVTGAIRLTPFGITAEGERVAVETESYAELKSGRVYNNIYHFLFVVRDGKIASVKEYLDTEHVRAVFVDP